MESTLARSQLGFVTIPALLPVTNNRVADSVVLSRGKNHSPESVDTYFSVIFFETRQLQFVNFQFYCNTPLLYWVSID